MGGGDGSEKTSVMDGDGNMKQGVVSERHPGLEGSGKRERVMGGGASPRT